MQPPNFRLNELVLIYPVFHSKELKLCFTQTHQSFLLLKHWVWLPSEHEMDVKRKRDLLETSVGSFLMSGSLSLACPSPVSGHALTQIRRQHSTLDFSVCRHRGCISQILPNTLIYSRILLFLSHKSTEIHDFLKHWQVSPFLIPCWKIQGFQCPFKVALNNLILI